jgi:hypothetical protein
MRWAILGSLRVADDVGTEIRLPAGWLRVLRDQFMILVVFGKLPRRRQVLF